MERLYKISEVAEVLSVSRQTVWRWIKDGKLPVVTVNGIRRVSQEDVIALVEREKEQS